jgi:hypothetical protein
MADYDNIAAKHYIEGQVVLNKTAALIQSGRQLKRRDRLIIQQELYELIDQYWKCQEKAMNAQVKAKL